MSFDSPIIFYFQRHSTSNFIFFGSIINFNLKWRIMCKALSEKCFRYSKCRTYHYRFASSF